MQTEKFFETDFEIIEIHYYDRERQYRLRQRSVQLIFHFHRVEKRRNGNPYHRSHRNIHKYDHQRHRNDKPLFQSLLSFSAASERNALFDLVALVYDGGHNLSGNVPVHFNRKRARDKVYRTIGNPVHSPDAPFNSCRTGGTSHSAHGKLFFHP